LIGAALTVLGAATPPAIAAEPAQDQLAVTAAVRAFHAALAEGDSAAVLRLLADDAVILEAGGLETRAEYRAHHLPEDIAFARAVPTTQGEPTVIVHGDVAWVASTSRTTGTFHDRPIDAAGAELVILARGSEGWTIRAVHWSSRSVRGK
jgi:ketosteroid isomerase-like protein